jgi:hypothetical protein
MPLVFNNEKMQYEWEAPIGFGEKGWREATGVPQAGWTPEQLLIQEGQREQAGGIVKYMSAPGQFGVAAGTMLGPRWRDQPHLARAVGRTYNPMYGGYLTQFPGYEKSNFAGQSFAQYLHALRARETGVELEGGGFSPAAGPQTGWAGTTSAYDPDAVTPTNWADMMNVARSLSPTYTGPVQTATNLDRWSSMFQGEGNEARVAALAALATNQPQMGSIYGGLARRGLQQAQEAYFGGRPGATAADWLGYITRIGGEAGAAYQV